MYSTVQLCCDMSVGHVSPVDGRSPCPGSWRSRSLFARVVIAFFTPRGFVHYVIW